MDKRGGVPALDNKRNEIKKEKEKKEKEKEKKKKERRPE